MCDISKEFESGNPRQEKTMYVQEGLFIGQMGIGMYEMNCYMLRRFEKKCKFLF